MQPLSTWKIAILIGMVMAGCQPVSAATILDIALDTTPLIGHPAEPFSIAFAFTDGSGIGDGNNIITVSDVDFGGGSALGSPVLFGGASGDLATGVVMTDTSLLSLFFEAFAPGSHGGFGAAGCVDCGGWV